MPAPAPLDRRTVLKGLAGVTLSLPYLEAMGGEAARRPPRRFCALYTANGMSLPNARHGIPEWSWFPAKEGKDFELGKSTEPLRPFRDRISFLGGLQHPNGSKADSHICSDMWLTGAPLHDPKPGAYNTVSLDQVIAQHTKKDCRQPSLVLSIDAGVGFLSRTGTISYNGEGKPIPAENNPRRVFNRLFRGDASAKGVQRERLQGRLRLVDAVLESSRTLRRKLGKSDGERMDQYLTSLDEIEGRLVASERWLDVPIKAQDYGHLNLDATSEGAPGDYYRNMLDLIALAFDADITRSVAFMLSREDGMGVSDTFPIKLGLGATHHNLSHAEDKDGQTAFARYDRFLAEQIAHFLGRLAEYRDAGASLLDNTIVLFGSGASTTHNPTNLPTLLAGGAGMGLKHGTHWRQPGTPMSNLYLSILHSMGIEEPSFSDSTGVLSEAVFTRV
ncbi:hypothetical protein OJF2_31960 [Aquisphaera giovannonii]|uniref:DUF1552 domain-containing protein n=1 Tax=Aquisphaera giovannonii TaxID=406548 RepID=A0A5B9W3K2_9BACT|nr:DUF1552 domain-containing protein [Aquisphaera giovannonii]QEH34655.1 hypothetical protein OJF2_31960 [Aquisphaera giovannonii]